MRSRIVSGPAPLITIFDVSDSTEDMILATQRTFDGPNGWLNSSVGKQTIELVMDEWTPVVCLRWPPHLSIVSVKYDDADGIEQTVAPGSYKLRGGRLIFDPGYVFPDIYAYPGSIRVRYEAGYEASDVPAEAKQALTLMVADVVQMSGVGAGSLRSETVEGVGQFAYLDPDKISAATRSAAWSLLSGLRIPIV